SVAIVLPAGPYHKTRLNRLLRSRSKIGPNKIRPALAIQSRNTSGCRNGARIFAARRGRLWPTCWQLSAPRKREVASLADGFWRKADIHYASDQGGEGKRPKALF